MEFGTGVTILTGWNATNRISVLRAIIAAMGSDDVAQKADAKEGLVELEVEGEVYYRSLSRQQVTVVADEEPQLEDAQGGGSLRLPSGAERHRCTVGLGE